MLNRWNDTLAAQCADTLALRAYSSRLLGADPSLVLHGGGNTSVKIDDTLWVKGSGSDLAQVTPADFTPLALAPVRALLRHAQMSNEAMMQTLAPLVREPGRPKPSIETLLHAALPFPFVEHTHADAILAVTNTVNGDTIAERVFGAAAPRAPFRQSGFDLAKACMDTFARSARPETIGLILLQHGVFAFGATARGAYENMLALVEHAERYLAQQNAWALPASDAIPSWTPEQVARLRRDLCLAAGYPLLASVQDDPQTMAFARRRDLVSLLEEGPATPQHAVFIKRLPLIGDDVAGYATAYRAYVAGADAAPDPAPRVVLHPAFGALVAGYGIDYLSMAQDIFQHGREIMTRASAHDRYRGLPAAAILEAEIHYGGFEHRLRQAHAPRDTLRGLCVAIAVDDPARTGQLKEALSARGAAIVVAPQVDPRSIVHRYGGLDALITDASGRQHAGTLSPLLELAPFGGAHIDAHRDIDDIIEDLTPP